MQGIITVIARLVRAVGRVYTRKWSFLALFAVALFGSVSVLAELDLLPEASAPTAVVETVRATNSFAAVDVSSPARVEAPVQVEIAKIKLSATVLNPTATDIAILDRELLKGAVRYPTSASLGEAGNVILFGHSSYLPVVNNPAYKAFNDIQKLTAGDTVTVYSSTTAYTYEVKSVTKESVEENKPIPLSIAGKKLTLVTCNSFATKSDRFVVVADFVESHPLGA